MLDIECWSEVCWLRFWQLSVALRVLQEIQALVAPLPLPLNKTLRLTPSNIANMRRSYERWLAAVKIEADVLAQKENPDMERVQGKRELAKDLLEAADQFDMKARELQRNVPHGMVH